MLFLVKESLDDDMIHMRYDIITSPQPGSSEDTRLTYSTIAYSFQIQDFSLSFD